MQVTSQQEEKQTWENCVWVAEKKKKLKEFKAQLWSEHMNNWQYLSLGDPEQNELFPKSKSWGFLVP